MLNKRRDNMKNANVTKTQFINKLRREHRWLMPIMCLITGLFAAVLAYFDLGLIQQLGLCSLMIGSILCARASMVMTHKDDRIVLSEAAKNHLVETGLIILGCILFIDVSAPSIAALIVLFVGYEDTKRRVQQARQFAYR